MIQFDYFKTASGMANVCDNVVINKDSQSESTGTFLMASNMTFQKPTGYCHLSATPGYSAGSIPFSQTAAQTSGYLTTTPTVTCATNNPSPSLRQEYHQWGDKSLPSQQDHLQAER